jgi:hypothetical protein
MAFELDFQKVDIDGSDLQVRWELTSCCADAGPL